MVFENLTLFDIHLDDAQFGPTTIGGDDTDATEADADESDVDGGGVGRVIGVGLGVAVLATISAFLLARRLRGDSEPAIEIEDFEDEQPA